MSNRRGGWEGNGKWWHVAAWTGAAAILALHALLTQRGDAVPYVAAFGVGGVINLVLWRLPRNAVRIGIHAFLIALVAATIATPIVLTHGWDRGGHVDIVSAARSLWAGVDRPARRAFRIDGTPNASTPLTVTFEGRATYEDSGTAWFQSHREVEVAAAYEEAMAFARISIPDVQGAYVRKTFVVPAELDATAIRVRWRIRTSVLVRSDGCRGLRLALVGSMNDVIEGRCVRAAGASGWETLSADVKLVNPAATRAVHVDVFGFEGATVDAGAGSIEAFAGEAWMPLGPSVPGVPYMSLSYLDVHDDVERRVAWYPLPRSNEVERRTVHAAVPAGSRAVRARLHVDAHAAPDCMCAELTSIVVRDAEGRFIPPRSPTDLWSRRWNFGTTHPNVAGHMAALTAIAAFTFAHSRVARWVFLAAGLVVVVVTGSRAALMALVVAFVVLLLAMSSQLKTMVFARRAAVLSAVVLVATIPWFLTGRWAGDAASDLGVRTEIWRVALEAFWGSVATGIAYSERASVFTGSHDIPLGGTVGHAHNVVLELASVFGLFGLAAVAWLAGVLVIWAWVNRNWKAANLLVAVGILQSVDFTLLSLAVLIPLIAGLRLASFDWARVQEPGRQGVGAEERC